MSFFRHNRKPAHTYARNAQTTNNWVAINISLLDILGHIDV